MGALEVVTRKDGQKVPVYVAGPAGPAVIVVQEWWGLNEQIKRTADRLGEAGFYAIVPDLYRGQLATTADEANHMMSQLDWGNAVEDIRAIAAKFEDDTTPCGLSGFCMGGAVAFLAAAANLPGLRCAAPFYGMPQNLQPLSGIRIPIQAHWATKDYWCTPAAVEKLEAVLAQGHVKYEAFWYEADHAFMNEARPEVYAAAEAELAWDRLEHFLRAHLMPA